jgi:hypothetical protein
MEAAFSDVAPAALGNASISAQDTLARTGSAKMAWSVLRAARASAKMPRIGIDSQPAMRLAASPHRPGGWSHGGVSVFARRLRQHRRSLRFAALPGARHRIGI